MAKVIVVYYSRGGNTRKMAEAVGEGARKKLRLYLKYGPRGEEIINRIERVSKPGCRVYKGTGDLGRVLNGLGISIISTSSGIMSDRRCREQKVGGEVLCTVY